MELRQKVINLTQQNQKPLKPYHSLSAIQVTLHKIGLEKWTESKAGDVRKTYFTKPWTLA